MTRIYGMTIGAGLAIAVCLTASLARPDDGQDKKGREKQIEEWMKLTGPNENHKRLDMLAGKWTIATKFAGPNGTWIESAGASEFHWSMGGRFLIEETKTTMEGQPFEWMGIHGYDRQKQKYTSAWIDNLGTSIDSMLGTWDEATKTLAYSGEVDDPATGQKQHVKWSIRIDGPDKTTTEMYEGTEGKMEKAMEIVATRIK